MQLVRNLYLGHERTLSRKGQEVVLAWILEHLTGLSKQRLLEIYLNIIEWGPGIHGADEATRYYFGHDAGTRQRRRGVVSLHRRACAHQVALSFRLGRRAARERARPDALHRPCDDRQELARRRPSARGRFAERRAARAGARRAVPARRHDEAPDAEADSLRGADADTTPR